MSNFILAGLFTEGTTDVRFLSSVVERTLIDVVFDCAGEFETKVEVITINKSGLNFNQQIIEASRFAFDKFGVVFLFVHTDSDASTDELIFRTKIVPAEENLLLQDDEHCKHIVAIVPIHFARLANVRAVLRAQPVIYAPARATRSCDGRFRPNATRLNRRAGCSD